MSLPPKRLRRNQRDLDPLFSQKSVDETTDTLLKLLKLVFTRISMTSEEFGARHLDWWTNGGGKGARSTAPTSLNNFRAAMTQKATITWEYFLKVTASVVKLDIINMSITFRHPQTKEIITVSSDSTYTKEREKHEKDMEDSNKIE